MNGKIAWGFGLAFYIWDRACMVQFPMRTHYVSRIGQRSAESRGFSQGTPGMLAGLAGCYHFCEQPENVVCL